jgi:heat shock protein HslJ
MIDPGTLRAARAMGRLLPGLIVAACATAAPGLSAPLTDVRWRLVELEGARALAPSAERTANLRFSGSDARVSGFTTCNNLFGGYDRPGGDRLRLSELASTRMACVDPALGQQEQRFMAVLGRIERFAIAADTLTLFDDTRPLARFVAEQSR